MSVTTTAIGSLEDIEAHGWIGILSILAATISSWWVYSTIDLQGTDLIIAASVPGALIGVVGVVAIVLSTVETLQSISEAGWIGVVTSITATIGSAWIYDVYTAKEGIIWNASVPGIVIGFVGIVLIFLSAVSDGNNGSAGA